MNQMIEAIKEEVKKVIVGQDELIDSMLIGLITGGHILVEGVPGLAKTTAVNALAKALGLKFNRVQFTPDLLPSDITGVEIYNPKTNEFDVKEGPVFTNLLLADEINRAPAKVQAALLEVMQEKQVTISDRTYKLDKPFLTMATQNPVEQEGTYPLPEAQLDRFMLKVVVGYNTLDEEFEIVKRVADGGFEEITAVANRSDIENLSDEAKNVNIDDELLKYIINIIGATREPLAFDIFDIDEYIEFGASPRASINLYNAARAVALIRGKDFVTPLDIAQIAPSILRHRLILNYKAQAQGISADNIIEKIIKAIPVP